MKTLKFFSLLACMLLCCITSNLFSQDVIFLFNGDEIEAKIIKVGSGEIEYKKWSNQDGPTYTEQKGNIYMIKYQNGEKDVFNNVETPVSSPATTVVKSESLIKPQPIKKDNKVFFGINLGDGLSLIDEYEYNSDGWGFDSYIGFASTIGLDLTFPKIIFCPKPEVFDSGFFKFKFKY